jgi:Domain of unknown function (DUF336).
MPFKTWNNRPSRTKWEDHMLLSLKRLAQCAAGACLLSSVPQAASAQAVIMERQLSFDAARAMATGRARDLPQERLSGVGDRGRQCRRVRAAFRDDGTPPHTYDASFRKAYTARTYRISTSNSPTHRHRERPAGTRDDQGCARAPGGCPSRSATRPSAASALPARPAATAMSPAPKRRSRRSGIS